MTVGPETTPDYDPHAFPPFAVTVDIVVMTIIENDLRVLLIRRAVPPFLDSWALPGGFVRPDEDLDTAAVRELAEETSISQEPGHIEQFGTYGHPDRDPRMRVVSVGYWPSSRTYPPRRVGATPHMPNSFLSPNWRAAGYASRSTTTGSSPTPSRRPDPVLRTPRSRPASARQSSPSVTSDGSMRLFGIPSLIPATSNEKSNRPTTSSSRSTRQPGRATRVAALPPSGPEDPPRNSALPSLDQTPPDNVSRRCTSMNGSPPFETLSGGVHSVK